MYTSLEHYIDGNWVKASGAKTQEVINPATSKPIGELSHASKGDLDKALAAADKGFKAWRKVSAFERGKILRKAADLVRARAEEIAKVLTQEQGKVFMEAKLEVQSAGDILDWYAGEGQRAYGRIIPARADGVRNMVIMEPIGPVAAFTPWNFPVTQAVRKIAAALAAGCSIIIKCPEETPGSPIGLVKALHDAGVPPGVLNLVYGVPAEISEYLIPHPIIRKISFTGSVPVGKHLNALAASHMKRATMELGGHAPVLVFDDADVDGAAKLMGAFKYRNAGQVCVSPTRFFVHDKVYDNFVGKFIDIAKSTKVGDGLAADTRMGPLANPRRVNAIEAFVTDAQDKGAKVEAGGKRIGNQGNFFEPTVLTDVPENARIMSEEPFGPVAVMLRFKETDEVLDRANKLPFGLASYAFTKDAKVATKVADALESGMVTINHFGIALPETPFGGVKDSGFGHEGGSEGLQVYLQSKFVSHLG
ncbi:MAG TPA: NAD-dependent succinate-semialdehyde dehydrogenase [Hyphomicrobiaceae bacterium]|jgi:succinate-semialdehyde dehydrogenase / glutarate-semialdehyde dehydrogenase|nr:NAD-dependent succinate-semialdehyde dehydrogenase [Hyphomicrobiaceae bacterium]